MPNLPMFSINTDRPGHSSTHACLGALLPPCVLSLLAAWKPALSGGSAACVVTLYCPPADREFIEGRRRALKRFINLVARHPPFSEDVLLKLFLSFSGSVSVSLGPDLGGILGPETLAEFLSLYTQAGPV